LAQERPWQSSERKVAGMSTRRQSQMFHEAAGTGVEKIAEAAANVAVRVAEKDQYIARLHFSEEQELSEMEEATAGLANSLQVQRAARKHLQDDLNGRLQQVHENRSGDILKERQGRHAVETQLERLTDKKVAEVRGCLVEDASMQGESEKYAQLVCDEVCHLYKDIEQARKYRLDRSQKLSEGVQVKLSEVREAVSAEQRIRLESQDTLLELFGQMSEKLEQELKQCKKEQSMSIDRVLKLMEAVVPKLNGAQSKASGYHEDLQENSDARHLANLAAINLRKSRKSVGMALGARTSHA